MKTIVLYTFILIIYSNINICLGQKITYTGSITNTKSQPIFSAFVRLTKINKDTITISFTTTNNIGKYKILAERTKDTLLIIVQHLGYEKQFFSYLSDSCMECTHNFVLEEKATNLHEFIFRKSAPIKISNDTTVYKTSQFTDGTEKNVEDILKKLPGINISEGGDITFKGKRIDKITIEGEDFFSKNYKLISKNMPSFTLDKVEAIENYNENSMLKGITKSDKTILNLGLKEDLKSTFFGNIQAGVGITKRYDLQNTIFNLNSKLKIGQITNLNNVGTDPISEVEYSLQAKNNIETQETEINPVNFQVIESTANPNIGKSRYINNNTKLAAINLSKKLPYDTKTRLWIYAFQDKTNQVVSSNSEYTLGDSILSVYDFSSLLKKPLLLRSNFETETTFQENFQLKFQSSNNFSSPKSYLSNENRIFNFQQNIQTNYNEANFNSTNTIEATKKISIDKALIIYLTYQKNKSSSDYTIFSKQYSFLKNPLKPTDGVSQEMIFRGEIFGLKIKYVEHKNKRFTNLNVGVNSLNNNIYSAIHLLNRDSDSSSLSNLFKNDGSYNKRNLVGEINNIWELNKWSIFINGSYHLGKIESGFLTKAKKYNFFNKLVGLKFKPIEGSTFSLVQSQIYIVSNLSDLASGYYLINLRNFQRGSASFNMIRNDITMFNYSLIDMINQFSFISNFNFIKGDSPYINNASIINNLSFIDIVPTDKNTKNEILNANIKADKYIHALKTRFKIGTEWSQNQSFYKINNSDLKKSFQQVFALESLFSTGFDFPLNFELGLITRNSKFRLNQNEQFQSISNKAINTTFRINTSKQITGNIKFEYNLFNINNVKSNALFADLWLSYKPLKGKFSYEINGKNIFNAKSISSLAFNNFYSSANTFQLINRIITFNIEYRFGEKKN